MTPNSSHINSSNNDNDEIEWLKNTKAKNATSNYKASQLVVDDTVSGFTLFIIVVVLWMVVSSWNNLFRTFVKDFFLNGKDPDTTVSLITAVVVTVLFFALTEASGLDWKFLVAGDTSAASKKQQLRKASIVPE